MLQVTFVQRDGRPTSVTAPAGWSVMEVARKHDVPGIIAECGGGAACSTCHVHVDPDWIERTGTATEAELGLLDLAPGSDATSRLSCQIILTDALDGLVVRVPELQYGE